MKLWQQRIPSAIIGISCACLTCHSTAALVPFDMTIGIGNVAAFEMWVNDVIPRAGRVQKDAAIFTAIGIGAVTRVVIEDENNFGWTIYSG